MKKLKPLIIVVLILTAVFSYFHFYVNPQIVSANTAKIKNHSINILNSAITTTLNQNDYDDLIKIFKDDNGNITMMEVNSKNVNNLNNNIMTNIQSKLDQDDILNYSLPFGTFTGIPALSGIGPKIDIKVVPIGNVQTEYRSSISSLSINQSYHKIYINIKISVSVILPLYTQTIDISNQVLVAETILVGKIPSTYLNTDNLTNALNLIP
ncbi:MAG: sporulation protein YunB [Clostridia bacterium]|nr:sporulation protein YunB [Clostridia bacterium]